MCGVDYGTGLADHMRLAHPAPIQVPCPQCLQLFAASELENHIKAQHQPKEDICTLCKTAVIGLTMDQHYSVVHPGLQKCAYCKSYVKPTNMASHITTQHPGQGPIVVQQLDPPLPPTPRFTCDRCGDGFNTVRDRQTHDLRCQARVKCPKCGDQQQYYKLSNHIAMCNGQAPVRGGFCSLCQITVTDFLAHGLEQGHKQCALCYKWDWDLKAMGVQYGREYYTFRTNDELQSHLLNYHYPCQGNACNKIFESRIELFRHRLQKHNLTPIEQIELGTLVQFSAQMKLQVAQKVMESYK